MARPRFDPDNRRTIAYVHESSAAVQLCADGTAALAFILQPTPLAAVRKIAVSGELMPQKSTFFYPKLATGLLVNPLE